MKTYQILLNNEWIEYDLTYKNIKSLYIKIADGRITVSAPKQMPISFIEETIEKYQDRLLKGLERYSYYADYKDQGFVYIFDKCYKIILRDINKRTCQIHSETIYVYHSHIQNTIENYLKQVLREYIEERVIYYLARYYDLDMPVIEIKKYKRRWGSCFYKENKISFHTGLIHLSKDLIDYVIVHELTHFIYPDHSKNFYLEISKRMSDYKERQNKLKEKHT